MDKVIFVKREFALAAYLVANPNQIIVVGSGYSNHCLKSYLRYDVNEFDDDINSAFIRSEILGEMGLADNG